MRGSEHVFFAQDACIQIFQDSLSLISDSLKSHRTSNLVLLYESTSQYSGLCAEMTVKPILAGEAQENRVPNRASLSRDAKHPPLLLKCVCSTLHFLRSSVTASEYLETVSRTSIIESESETHCSGNCKDGSVVLLKALTCFRIQRCFEHGIIMRRSNVSVQC